MQRDFNAGRRDGDPVSLKAQIEAERKTQAASFLLALLWAFTSVPMLLFHVGRILWTCAKGLIMIGWTTIREVVRSPKLIADISFQCYLRDHERYVTRQMVRHLK
jgi:hypothetical protein